MSGYIQRTPIFGFISSLKVSQQVTVTTYNPLLVSESPIVYTL